MARLIALEPIQHDGVAYAPGETLDVPDAALAAALIDARAAEPAPAKKQAKPAQQD